MTLLSHQLKSANNVSFQKKNTKRSSSTLLRLVFFFSERTLCVKNVRTRVSITVYNWLKSGDIVTRRNRICSKSFSIVNCTIIIYLILKTIENWRGKHSRVGFLYREWRIKFATWQNRGWSPKFETTKLQLYDHL